jgi:hypothetical protein
VLAKVPRAAFAALALIAAAAPARGQSTIFAPETLHGFADLRLTAIDGEKGWLDGGFGKTGARRDGLDLAEAAVEWKPRFNFALSAVVSADLQPAVDRRVDLGEAYLKWKAPPQAWGRLSARAGLMFPPVSQENDGVAWSNPDMLSSSAISSWIGEEVKVIAAEATYTRQLGDHELSATAAVFGWNDTSGALLTFRGWALGSAKANARTEYDLPPLSTFMRPRQGDETYPLRDLDGRAGTYARLEWRPPARFSLNAFYYDNRGDLRSVDAERQWAWRTRFADVGLSADLDDATRLQAQALTGQTYMGFHYAGQTWADVSFDAAYVGLRRRLGEDALSGRLDAFDVRDRSLKALDNNAEHGWAATLDWRHRLAAHADLVLEGLHVESERPSRAYAGLASHQTQTLAQAALRLGF